MTRASAGRRDPRAVGPAACAALAVAFAWAAGSGSATAGPETVTIALPAFVAFHVTDVTAPTPGVPGPTPVVFTGAALSANRALDISVRADSDFVPAGGGPAIPASHVSWTVSNVSNGLGASGTLATTAYALVFRSVEDHPVHGFDAGGFDVTWTLAAPGSSIRAGAHHLTLRWKLESIRP